MLPATALGRGSRKEPLQPGGFLLSHTLWAEGSKSSGREGGHRTGQSLFSICFYRTRVILPESTPGVEKDFRHHFIDQGFL